MSLVGGPKSFYLMRFLLGVVEAGFFPGIILYLTYWFPREDRARVVSVFMAAVPISTVIGAPLSGLLLGLDGVAGLKGWQWLFVLEGIPAVLLGLAALKLLTDKPDEATWLSANERRALSSKLAAEAKETQKTGYAELVQALLSPRVLTLGLLYFCIVVGLYGIGFWMPQVIQGFGLSHVEIGFLTAVPYLVASVAMVIWGWHSDITGERTWHVALPLFIAAATFAWSAFTGTLTPTMFALTLATLGIYAAIGTFWSFPTAILTGTAAAAGLALINSLGNAGGFFGPFIVGWMKQVTGTFTGALMVLAGALALGAAIALYFGKTVTVQPAAAVTPASKPSPRRTKIARVTSFVITGQRARPSAGPMTGSSG
jgi:MFS transporter, ACS family, tartrate transporter